jgi:transcriptional regulator with GAF, ATPase, and Fis domain
VLSSALDAAIELTRAERGFVIVRGAKRLDVAVARNVDRERIGRSHLKFSRGIAEKVVETGEPIVAVDAMEDARFAANESVHAMQLRSVACVPIRGPDELYGAIYLDNRFERGRFAGTDVGLLLGFADQVAIALRNARLYGALETRTRELEASKSRVEELLRGREQEIDRLESEVRTAREESRQHRYEYGTIVGRSAAMRKVLATLDRVIDSPLSVLLQGESGTCIELVARAIHFHGARRKGRFVALNCAAVPEALLESELFGHVRGAFTGADADREGLLIAARGGTLFLDEVGEMSLAMQAKLLRALQEREVRPVGSSRQIPIDARIVSATNRSLRKELGTRFREDLFYRLAVVEITMPPLRDRPEDLPELARAILGELAAQSGRPPPRIDGAAMAALAAHAWPGNVRELVNVLSRALAFAEDRIAVEDLALAHTSRSRAGARELEHRRIRAALEASAWNVAEVSRSLGIPRNTLYRKLKAHGLDRPPGRKAAERR